MNTLRIGVKKLVGLCTDVLDDSLDALQKRPQPRADVPALRDLPAVKCGMGDGRWTVCAPGIRTGSIVYSVGVGHDISFDLDLIETFGCQVHAFDPTILSKSWLSRQSLPGEFHFHDLGLAAYDGTARFRLPTGHSVSFTMADEVSGDNVHEGQVMTLASIMERLNHDHVDLLKIDIEGAEFDLIPDLVANAPKIGQLLVEFHDRLVDRGPEPSRQALADLAGAGFQLFNVSRRGLEFTLIGPAFGDS